MTSVTRFSGSVAALGLAAALLGACGSSSNNSGAGSSPGGSATVDAFSTGLGTILVDGQGNVLYVFDQDKSGTSSACTDASCVADWPPLMTSTPSAGSGVDGSKLTTLTRSDGSKQAVYNGHPLYTFSGDKAAGQTKGQGQNAHGGYWYVIGTDGNRITTSAGAGSSSSNGYGY
jgi:predicted lipoprotein with Yx(FWY)xxD motif